MDKTAATDLLTRLDPRSLATESSREVWLQRFWGWSSDRLRPARLRPRQTDMAFVSEVSENTPLSRRWGEGRAEQRSFGSLRFTGVSTILRRFDRMGSDLRCLGCHHA